MTFKRLFDIAGAFVGLVVLLPVLLILWVVVRWSLGSPALFRQPRAGRGGQPFILNKFRTMTEARDPQGRLLPDEKRMYGIGTLLRKTSLDELPELLNVLKGDMSLVGPRPLLTDYLPRYSPQQTRRHEIRPGITGWAQVNGRNATTWEDRLALDVWYVDNRSFWLDLKILATTVWKVFWRQDISQPGHATMPEFKGSGSI
jgi:sugar transferase EpsL